MALHCTLCHAEHLVNVISAMNVDYIDMYPAGAVVNFQCSGGGVVLPRFWAPQTVVLTLLLKF